MVERNDRTEPDLKEPSKSSLRQTKHTQRSWDAGIPQVFEE